MPRAIAELTRDELVVSGGATLRARLSTGTLSIAKGRWRPVRDARALVELDGGLLTSTAGWHRAERPRRFAEAHGRGVRAVLLTEAIDGLRLHLEVCAYDAQPFLLLRLGVENRGVSGQRVRRLAPLATDELAVASAPSALRVYRHGWQSWTPTLSLSGAQRDIDVQPPMHAPADTPSARGAFASEEVAAVFDPAAGKSFLAGFVSARAQWTQMRLAGRAFEAVAHADGAHLRPGTTLWSERLLVDLSDYAPAALERYGGALAREMGARVPARVPTGWCSWYYYYPDVSEPEVLQNLAFLKEHRARLPFDCVQIDDGYQANIGDWTDVNDKFPRGMAWLAAEIRGAGFTPGLWLAPFIAGNTSRLYAEHPDWFVRDDAGEPVPALTNWRQANYGLDCSHPDVQAWLRDVVRTITRDWGYEYLKIDFLYGAAIPGRRHDPDSSRIQAYRRGLQAIREAAGDRFILGCGALMGASVGLVDGMRIGPDVAPWWRYNRPQPRRPGRPRASGAPSVENALRNVFSRAWMHGRLWANDPDCLLARQSRTKLTLPEVQSLASAIALSGGMVLSSDNLSLLSRERLDITSLLLPPLGDAPDVPDLLEHEMPSRMEVVVEREFETWRLIGAFNHTGRRRRDRVALPRGRWHVFELWSRRYYGVRERHIDLVDVPPHGVRLLALRRALQRPQLLASTFHVSMGGREIENISWDSRRRTLRIALQPVAKHEGEVLAVAPPGFRFDSARLDGDEIAARRSGRVVSVAFTLDGPRTLELRYR